MFYVYIIYSSSRKRYYAGQTNEINQRLERHNNGKVRSTRTGIPWVLEKVFEIESRSEAMKLETKIKSAGIERFLQRLR